MYKENSKSERRVDSRTIRTKKLILDTILDMLTKGHDISVKALSETCGINRNTFYIHYHNIDEAISDLQTGIIRRAIDKVDENSVEKLWRQPDLLATSLIEVLCASEKIMLFAFGMESSAQFCMLLTKELVQNEIRRYSSLRQADFQEHFTVDFMIGGFVYMMYDWYRQGRKVPADALVKKLDTLFRFTDQS